MLKKIFLCLVIFLFSFTVSYRSVSAQSTATADTSVTLHLFWSKTCPHCAKEKVFLEQLVSRYPQLKVQKYEVTTNQQNAKFLGAVGQALNAEVSGVPFTVIGEKYVTGYLNDETTGENIEALIQAELASPSADVVGQVQQLSHLQPETTKESEPQAKPQRENVQINLPLFGTISSASFSLPVLTILIALLDGFNPCAMWVLIFLITLLLNMKDKKRMWLLGSSFIIASGGVYFLFLTAWLNFFLVIGYIAWIRTLIGLFAVGAGVYQLQDAWKNRYGTCKVIEPKKRKLWFAKIETIVAQKRLYLAILGMIILAAAINLVELACSAGLPAIYTQVLALSHLPAWQYYGLLLLYIFIFMLDDLIVFFVAMTTLRTAELEGKYARYSHIIGAAFILLLGILLILKPEWLMFG